MPLHDRGKLEPARERPEHPAEAVEPRRAEGAGDRRVAVPHEQRALKREREPLDEIPRSQRGVVRIGKLILQFRDGPVEPGERPVCASRS